MSPGTPDSMATARILSPASLYDIFGNALATCPAVSFTVRIEGMSNQSISPAVPTSGKAATGLLTFDGTNAASSASSSFTVDGYLLPYEPICGGSSYTSQTGGWQVQTFNSACFPNGQHMIVAGYYTGSIADPYLLEQDLHQFQREREQYNRSEPLFRAGQPGDVLEHRNSSRTAGGRKPVVLGKQHDAIRTR